MIGTIQSMAEHFPGFRPAWAKNQREERLLGVDLNGQMDSPLVQDAEVQRYLSDLAVSTNHYLALRLGIAPSAAITTVKPSGNSSQLLDAASGLHARWSPFYTRHVRLNTHSPIRRMFADQGVPMHPENGQTAENANTWVVPFPVAAPRNAVFRNDRSALQQLDYWLQVKQNWTEHQPSVTITYRPGEMDGIIAWCQAHKNQIAGLSFLPASDHAYPLAPYVETTQAEYAAQNAAFPVIDWSALPDYEQSDMTTAAQEVACSAGSCETL